MAAKCWLRLIQKRLNVEKRNLKGEIEINYKQEKEMNKLCEF